MAASCLSGGCETAREIATLTALISAHLQVILICGHSFMAVQGLLCALSYHMLICSAFICLIRLSCDLKFVII